VPEHGEEFVLGAVGRLRLGAGGGLTGEQALALVLGALALGDGITVRLAPADEGLSLLLKR